MEDNLNYELIGMRIRTHREKMKLTQEVISEKSGISISHMSNIENAKDKPSLACLVNIANALNTTTDHLLMDNVTAASTPHLLTEIKMILDDCAPEEIFIIAELAKTLKKSIRTKNMQPAEQ